MHKCKEQRKREAMARKMAGLAAHEAALQKLVSAHSGSVASANGAIQAAVSHLAKRYVECGYSTVEATGMANSVANGGSRTAWLSSLPKQLGSGSAKQISSIDEAVELVRDAREGAWGVLLEPHPALPAIKMTVGVPFAARSQTVHMSILAIDDLARKFQSIGLMATRTRTEFEEWARRLDHPLLVADDAIAAFITMDTDYSIKLESESATRDMTSWYPVPIDETDALVERLQMAGITVCRSREQYTAACSGME